MKPTNGKDPCAGNTGPSGKHSLNSSDYPTALLPSKALLKAHFQETGYLVHDAADGYIVVRSDWGLSRHCESIAELQAFALKLGVTQ